MAVRRTKKRFTVKFEVGLAGLCGIAIVCFCIFLWMFLFGVWTGQTLGTASNDDSDGLRTIAAKIWKKGSGLAPKDIPDSKSVDEKQQVRVIEPEEVPQKVPSFFALQVAAYKDTKNATKEVLKWRARDYESFYLAPEKNGGSFYRVFVGHYEKMAEAKKQAVEFEASGEVRFFITLVPSSEKRYP